MEMVLLTALGVGGATLIGVIIGFIFKNISHRFSDIVLSFAAGVMLAASFFSLLVPSMEKILTFSDNIYIAAGKYTFAVFIGVVLIWILNLLIPHEHNEMGHHGPYFDIKKAWLFVIAITLHKIPEGIAVGVAYSAENMINPLSL